VEAEFLALARLVDGKPSEPQDGQGVLWKLSTSRERQVVNLDVRRRNGCEPQDRSVFDGDVGDAQVVTELVLSGEQVKKAVEVRIA
jgi:hypothetical protein